MAVKIYYTYNSFPYSEKATRLSKQHGRGKMRAAVFVSIAVILAVVGLMAALVDPAGKSPLLLAVPVIVGIGSGIGAEILRNVIYHKMIKKAAQEDIALIAKQDAEKAKELQIQLYKLYM